MKYRTIWDAGSEKSVLAARLRLYSYAFPRNEKGKEMLAATPGTTKHDMSQSLIAAYLTKSYAAAIRIIDLSCPRSLNNPTKSNDISQAGVRQPVSSQSALFWTEWDFANLLLAVFVLLQITRRWHYNEKDIAASDAISRAWSTFTTCIVVDGDHFSRICDIIDYVSRLEWPRNLSSTSTPSFSIRSRGGASIEWDLIQHARRRFENGEATYEKQLADPQTSVSPNNPEFNNITNSWALPELLPNLFDDVWGPAWDSHFANYC